MTGFRPLFVNHKPHPGGRRSGDDAASPRRGTLFRIAVAILWATLLGAALCVLLRIWPVESLVEPLNQSSDTAAHVRTGLARLSLVLAVLALIPVATGGLCCTVAMSGRDSAASWWPVVYAVILGWGAMGAVSVARFGLGALVTDMPVVVALVFWGAAFSRQTFRGIAGISWFLSGSVAAAAAGGFMLIRLATTLQPAGSDIQMTIEDRERLDGIQETLSRAATRGDEFELDLVERDVQLVSSRWLSQTDLPVSGEIRLPGEVVRVSLTSPAPGWPGRQLAIEADLQPELNVELHYLRIQIDRLEFGGVRMPQAVAWECAEVIGQLELESAPISRLLGCLDKLVVTERGLTVGGSLGVGSVSNVLQGGDEVSAGLVSEVLDCGHHLLTHSQGLPEGDGRLEGVMQLAFEWARDHSGSAVEANRAALVTVAVMVGSNEISHIMESGREEHLPGFGSGFTKFITVHNRRDLSQHLVASAGLAAWASQTASDAAGLLKEEWDSVGEGSGFSFADLAADRAGARLGRSATRDEPTARRIQEMFADGAPLSSYMPSVAGLPEEIRQKQFEQEYGGLTGDGFQQWDHEIDRRLATLPRLD